MTARAPGGSFFEVGGRRTWFTVIGTLGDRPPVICVPGGPGASHIYLRQLAGLAASHPVVFYDPLGSGASERTARKDWTVSEYADELAALIAALGVSRYHLLAHSVGGFAAYPHAIARPPGLAGLVLASCPASIPAYQAAMLAHLSALPADQLAAFERAERDVTLRDLAYLQIASKYLRYMLRQVPPADFMRGAEGTTNANVHRALKGGALLYTTELARWDVTPSLGAIAAPTLITCGRFDLVTPEVCADMQRRIPGAELEVFEHSAHFPHVEETARYIERVTRFLDACA